MLCHSYLVEMCKVIIYGNEHYTMFSEGLYDELVMFLSQMKNFSW